MSELSESAKKKKKKKKKKKRTNMSLLSGRSSQLVLDKIEEDQIAEQEESFDLIKK